MFLDSWASIIAASLDCLVQSLIFSLVLLWSVLTLQYIRIRSATQYSPFQRKKAPAPGVLTFVSVSKTLARLPKLSTGLNYNVPSRILRMSSTTRRPSPWDVMQEALDVQPRVSALYLLCGRNREGGLFLLRIGILFKEKNISTKGQADVDDWWKDRGQFWKSIWNHV